MTTTMIGKHMTAEPHPLAENEWVVCTRARQVLGVITYYPRWREHQFEPRDGTAFTQECLKALGEYLLVLNATSRPAVSP